MITTKCERCGTVGFVTWDEEQGDLCPLCLTVFETRREMARDEAEWQEGAMNY